MRRKLKETFILSVEGETEKWYFEHLRQLINHNAEASRQVTFNIKTDNPLATRRTFQDIYGETPYFHIFDYESGSVEHQVKFQKTLSCIHEINRTSGRRNRKPPYKPGYSNLTFELWILLHKMETTPHLADRTHYLPYLRNAYDYPFKDLDEYKTEEIFKTRVLNGIGLSDVLSAVKRAERLRANPLTHSQLKKRLDLSYAEDNPDTTVHECVAEIIKACGLQIT